MPDTITGGAYQDTSGNWHDADGRALNKEQVAAARKLLDARQQYLADLDAAHTAALAQRDPAARAFATLLADRQGAAPKAAKKNANADDDATME